MPLSGGVLKHLLWNIEYDKFDKKHYEKGANKKELVGIVVSQYDFIYISILFIVALTKGLMCGDPKGQSSGGASLAGYKL